jgi:hypothetical protein
MRAPFFEEEEEVDMAALAMEAPSMKKDIKKDIQNGQDADEFIES